MSVKIYFDMDGTVFDLYGKKNWLDLLENEKEGAFVGNFLPEIDLVRFFSAIKELSAYGVQFGIITWLPMQASAEYEEVCRAEKMAWIRENMPFISEFNCVSYGTPKQKCIQKRAQTMYLIDDNAEVCKMWETATQRKALNIDKNWTVVDALEAIIEEVIF